MRSNNLNKYAITHFIMHIASVLSAISAILSLSPSSALFAVWGHGSSLSPRFVSYILHVAYLVIHFSLLLLHFARESIAETWRVEEGKNVIKINSNDKSNKEQTMRCSAVPTRNINYKRNRRLPLLLRDMNLLSLLLLLIALASLFPFVSTKGKASFAQRQTSSSALVH
jgi:hypothetical protein